MKVYTVTNQKGGIGKTTTAHALATMFLESGARVLAVDLDMQGNFTEACKANKYAPGAYEALTRTAAAADVIQKTAAGFDILTGGEKIAKAAAELDAVMGKEYRVKETLETIAANYDYCIIDTPPALSLLTIAALTAADRLIIPAQADFFSLTAIRSLRDTIELIQKYTNPGLKVAGILLTRYPAQMRCLSRDLATAIAATAADMGTRLFNTRIREAVAVQEAQAKRRGLLEYAPKSNPANDYRDFFKELKEQEH